MSEYVSFSLLLIPPTISLTCYFLANRELFGPVLPVLSTPTLAAACEFVSARPRPLCVYQFSTSAKNKEYVEKHTMSGMISVNDLIIGGGVEGLPFGGSGPVSALFHAVLKA